MKVYVPCHITSIFYPVEKRLELREVGSRGVGFVLDKGVLTYVKCKPSSISRIRVYSNGKRIKDCVSQRVVEDILRKFKLQRDVEVYHEFSLPVGYGYGISGACSLGTSLSLLKELSIPFTYNLACEFAHVAEVKERTGLGDVVAESVGGIVIRRKEGSLRTGIVDKLFENGYILSAYLDEPIYTKDIIDDEDFRKNIEWSGKVYLERFLSSPTLSNLMIFSKRFAKSSGLMSEELEELCKEVEKGAIGSSMCMIGNSVFSVFKNAKEAEEIVDSFENAFITKIRNRGAEIVEDT